MCFSAPASFTSTVVLSIVGVLTIIKSREKRELLFASIPLLFAAQQFIEGLLWLELESGYDIRQYSVLTHLYTIFVGIFWSIIPTLSLLMIEPVKLRKNIMKLILSIGVFIAIYTIDKILQFPVAAKITDYCISYEYPTKQPHIMLLMYVIATCSAFLVSSYGIIRFLGIINITAFTATYYFYNYDLASVWCFFAALISGFIYFYFARKPLLPQHL